jgi:hypothetical protein
VNSQSLSWWEQLQLILLRLVSVILAAVDRLFNVTWGERQVARLSGRWQARLAHLDQTLADLEMERQQLQMQTEALAIQAAAIYLAGRSLTRDELRFDPAESREEELLDATIDLLVKRRLAAIESQEIEAGRYVYRLEPDWPAIQAYLAAAAERARPESAAWFREGLNFIDTAIGSQQTADQLTTKFTTEAQRARSFEEK